MWCSVRKQDPHYFLDFCHDLIFQPHLVEKPVGVGCLGDEALVSNRQGHRLRHRLLHLWYGNMIVYLTALIWTGNYVWFVREVHCRCWHNCDRDWTNHCALDSDHMSVHD